ncbi:MAG: hypothetical protein AAF197_09230 [Pseudomonadota bacterium]
MLPTSNSPWNEPKPKPEKSKVPKRRQWPWGPNLIWFVPVTAVAVGVYYWPETVLPLIFQSFAALCVLATFLFFFGGVLQQIWEARWRDKPLFIAAFVVLLLAFAALGYFLGSSDFDYDGRGDPGFARRR